MLRAHASRDFLLARHVIRPSIFIFVFVYRIFLRN
jgi:hypothetical protein